MRNGPLHAEFNRLEREFAWKIADHLIEEDGFWRTRTAATVSYPEHGNADCYAIEESSFWFRHRTRLIADLLRRYPVPSLWEIGAGNGYVARGISALGVSVVAVEPGSEGARNCSGRGLDGCICSSIEALALPPASLSAIGIFDVVEHIEDTSAFLDECGRVMVPGGRLFVSVPALPALWSQEDELAGHFRRYTKRTLDGALASAGFRRLQASYVMASLVPPIWLFRTRPYRKGRRVSEEQARMQRAQEIAPPRSFRTTMASLLLEAERKVAQIVPAPFGSSILAAYLRVD